MLCKSEILVARPFSLHFFLIHKTFVESLNARYNPRLLGFRDNLRLLRGQQARYSVLTRSSFFL